MTKRGFLISSTIAVGMACFALVTVFGHDLRLLFGSSANCLVGSQGAASLPAQRNLRDFAVRADGAEQGAVSRSEPGALQQPPEAPLQPNPWTDPAKDRLSTFAADVDTASYTLVRRLLREGRPVPASVVRPEEFVNYFRYGYEGPAEGAGPLAVHADLAPSPFHEGLHVLRVGIQGRRVSPQDRKDLALTFLVDVSGSMQSPDKLPLAQESLRILLRNLQPRDTVSIVTYAGEVSERLPPTSAREQGRILAAIDSLRSGGGTAMASGMELAYRNAAAQLRSGAVSRVIVLSDGDANIGAVGHAQILAAVKEQVAKGVTLSTVGFGVGNYRDSAMEQLADRGNGNAFYVDDAEQARRIFEEDLTASCQVIAADVKLQLELDPKVVRRYRLIGYENRAVADADFRDDRVDGGEVGAGHTVTALWELELAGAPTGSFATIHVRAKEPEGSAATEASFPIGAQRAFASISEAPASFRLALAAAAFGEALRGAEGVDLAEVAALAAAAGDEAGEAAELSSLVEVARASKLADAGGAPRGAAVW